MATIDEGRVDGDGPAVDHDSQPGRARLAKMPQRRPIVGEPALPAGPWRGGGRLDRFLDLRDQSIALLAEEELTVPQADVEWITRPCASRSSAPSTVEGCLNARAKRFPNPDDTGRKGTDRRTAASAVAL